MKCRACEAKNAHIASLEEQIEWLRLHNGTPTTSWIKKSSETESLDADAPWQTAAWISEDEEEIEAMQQAGLLDVSEMQAALAQVGALNTDINIEG